MAFRVIYNIFVYATLDKMYVIAVVTKFNVKFQKRGIVVVEE